MILSNSAITDEFCEHLKQSSNIYNAFTSYEAFDTNLSKEEIESFSELDPKLSRIYNNYKSGINSAKEGDFKKSLGYFYKALDLLNEQSAWMVNINCIIGYLHLVSGEYNQSINFFLKSLKNVSSDEDALLVLLCIGNTFQKINKTKDALKIYDLGQKLVGIEMMNSKIGMIRNAHLMTSLSEVYFKMGALEKAEDSIRIANNLFFQNKCQKETALTYIIWADIQKNNSNGENAFIKLNSALEICHTHGFSKTSSEILYKMSRLQSENNNPEKASLFLEEALYQAELSENSLVTACALSSKAQKCIQDENLDQAVEYLTQVIEKFEANGDKDYYESVCEILVNIYESKGQYESALYYSKKSTLAKQQSDFINQENEVLSQALFEKIKHLYRNRSNTFVKEKRALEKELLKQKYLTDIHLQDFKKLESNVKIISGGLINNLKKCADEVQNKYDEIKGDLNSQNANFEKMEELGKELKYFSKVVSSIESYINSNNNLLKKEMVDLNKVISKVLYELDSEIIERNCLIAVDRLPEIFGNEEQFFSLLKNILIIVMNDNDDSNPVVKLKLSETKESYVFTIYDVNNSNPLPNIQLKSDPEIKENPNYHLGIGYCESLVEQNGGKLWIPKLSDLRAIISFSFPRKTIS